MDMRYVGWTEGEIDESEIVQMSKDITDKTFHILNRPIVVPNKTIRSLFDSFLVNWESRSGDIFTRLNIAPRQRVDIKQQVILHAVSEIENDFAFRMKNNSFSAWNRIPSSNHLVSHPKIKLRNKRPMPMQFAMKM
jgi:hypothetical protein